VSSVWVLHRDSQGKPLRILEANVDITARTQAERALETQTTMLQSVLDNINDGVIAADRRNKFLWNPAAERILGQPHLAAIGKAVSHAFAGTTGDMPEERRGTPEYGVFLPDKVTPLPAGDLPLARAIRGQHAHVEMFFQRKRGEAGAWIEAAASPLRDGHGEICGGVVAFRDITQRVLADQEVRALNTELERRVMERTAELETANLELESFTYSVSHDLRAPLRHMSGFSKLLVEEFAAKLEPQAQHYLQRIEQGTRRMGQLVDELLNLARVGRRTLSLQTSGLNKIVEEVLEELEPEIEGRQVEWHIGSLPSAACDPVLIKQVFQNLISNALKYSRPRSPAVIEVGTAQRGGNEVIFVRDNGVGFNMKYADKLFGVFQRLHREEDFEGTGVGLATVKRIVRKHGGKVWADGELDRGATFYFTMRETEREDADRDIAVRGAKA
jgi:signal transduction histidine kinase